MNDIHSVVFESIRGYMHVACPKFRELKVIISIISKISQEII